MSDGKPLDDVLQQQLEYFAGMILKATNSKTIVVISVNGDEGLDIQASIHTPIPERREDVAQLQGQVGRALITVAATVLEKHTSGKFQLMIKKPNGEICPALSNGAKRAMVEKGLLNA